MKHLRSGFPPTPPPERTVSTMAKPARPLHCARSVNHATPDECHTLLTSTRPCPLSTWRENVRDFAPDATRSSMNMRTSARIVGWLPLSGRR